MIMVKNTLAAVLMHIQDGSNILRGMLAAPLHKGADAFTFEIIEEAEYIDPDQLSLRETILMLKYDTIKNGYNCKFSINLENIY